MSEEHNEVFDYLEQKGLNPKLASGGTNAECSCVYCTKKRHMYVVIERHEKGGRVRLPWYHHCKKCGKSGGKHALQKELGDLPDILTFGGGGKQLTESLFLKTSKADQKIRPPDVVPTPGADEEYHAALMLAYDKSEEADQYAKVALAWLIDERCLPIETLRSFKIGFRWIELGKPPRKKKYPFVCYPYYSLSGQLINFKFRMIDQEAFGFKKKKFFTKWTGCESHPYGIERLVDGADGENPCILVEGEGDLLALHALGFHNVLSLPNGANSWDHQWVRYFSSFETIYIALDNDAVGQEASSTIAEKIGKLRCLNVLFPLKDANDCLMAGYTGDQMQEYFEKSSPFPGGQITEIGDFEEQLVARLHGGIETLGVSTGYDGFDEIIGGWRTEEVTVWTGDTGMGKTTFVLNCAEKVAQQGVNVLYCPFEMKPIALMTKLVIMRERQEFMQLSEAQVRASVQYISRNVPLYFMDAYGQVGIDPILEMVKYSARYLGIGLFVLDPLQYAIQVTDPRFERIEIIKVMQKTQDLAKTLGIRIWMIVHPTKLPPDRKKSRKVILDDLPGSAAIKQDADNVIRIWARPNKYDAITPHVEITGLKLRSEFARPGTFALTFDPSTLHYTEQ